jgi:hypothetical protein
LVSKRPFFAQVWGPSEQPDQLRIDKRPLRRASMGEYAITALTAVAATPLVLTRLALGSPRHRARPTPAEFLGLAVSPDAQWGDALPDLVAELGVRRLLLRVPVWQRGRFADYRRFADRFAGCDVVVAVVQDRGSVCRPSQWRDDLRALFNTFAGRVTHVQLPLAPNRTKWGCVHLGEALDLLDLAEAVRRDFPLVKLVGPGIIDFEPATWLRALVNLRRYHLDVVGALLYVDRRGSPRSPQYGVFDLAGKLRLWRAIADVSPRCPRRSATPLWLTEFNWPLVGTKSWSPTGPEVQVDEATAATWLREYCQIAWTSGLVERVYWWQLLHPGFGLVDTREGTLRRRPTFTVYRDLLSGALPLRARTNAPTTDV